MKNNGIYVNSGNINSHNIVIGDNTSINSQEQKDEYDKKSQEQNLELQNFLGSTKNLVANGQTQTAISELLEFLKNKNGEFLNQILLVSSNFHDLQTKFSLNLIDTDFYKQNIAKINFAILQTIDNMNKCH